MVELRPLPEAGLTSGSRIGPYKVIRRIGSGGMGTVYLCQAVASGPIAIGQEVAVKLLKSGDNEERRRFERESRYLQSLRHPHIVRVLDTGEDQGRLYLVMPVIAGKRLDDLVGPTHPPLPFAQAIDWMVQALEALHVAHLAGILHRDLKPGNLMLDQDEQIKLLDFGLASAPEHESRLTREGDVVGTPAYMPPEQAAGRRDELSRRSDIYSMGACLYELLTGHQPFNADNAMATLRAIIDEPLTPPSVRRRDIPYDLETIVLVAMAKDQRDRYRTAEAMAGDLRRVRTGRRIHARRLPPIIHLWRSVVRNRRTVASVSLVIFALAASATLLTLRTLKAIREQASSLEQAASNAWTISYPPAGKHPELTWAAHTPLGKHAMIAALPAVDGPVRLSLTVTISDQAAPEPNRPVCALLIGDRDIGSGYRLELFANSTADRLVLLRENRVVASRELDPLARGEALGLTLENIDGNLTASISTLDNSDLDLEPQEFRFVDLVPLQGPDASGVYLMMQTPSVTIQNVLLERQRSGELVSALAAADAYREDKRYARAQQLYQAFILDHPDSPKVLEAKFRQGLCQEGLEDYTGALATFITISEEFRDSPYVLIATFHAWSCALKLGRYEDAESYFEAVRRNYDLTTLAASIPESTLRDLRVDYSTRALALAASETERAVSLALTAAEFASYLKEWQAFGDNQLFAGQLQLVLDQPGLAAQTFAEVARNQRLNAKQIVDALVSRGHAERLLNQPEQAEISYRQALALTKEKKAAAGERGRIRLWLGDLLADQGDYDAARGVWSEKEPALDSGTATILRRLARGDKLLHESDPGANEPDAAYWNARLALLMGEINVAEEWLHKASSQPPVYRWSTILAKHLSNQSLKTTQPEPEGPGR